MKKMFLILLTIILLFLGIIPICTANELDLSAEVNIEKTNTETPIISPYSKYVSFLSQNIGATYNTTQARYLQKELNAVMDCTLDTTGVVSYPTRAYLKRFQKKYNLPVTGNVDATTRNFLNVAYKYKKVLVKDKSLNVRNKAGTSGSTIIGVLTTGSMPAVLGETWVNGVRWYKILYNGKPGYISGHTKYVKRTFVEVDIVSQTLRFYKNGFLFLDSAITTGKKGSYDTQKGYYEIMFTDTNRYLQPSNAFVKYWMRFNNAKAQGLHDANWRGATENFNYFGGVVYKQNGRAGSKYSGSHGCVNIPPNKMPIIFQNAGLGTPVYVH